MLRDAPGVVGAFRDGFLSLYYVAGQFCASKVVEVVLAAAPHGVAALHPEKAALVAINADNKSALPTLVYRGAIYVNAPTPLVNGRTFLDYAVH